jgi:hypothetical protein
MKVLIACEESQEVCKAFRAKGHEAYSCDIQEPSGGRGKGHVRTMGVKMKNIQTAQKYKPGQYIVSLDHLMEQERIFFMGKIVNRSWFVNWQLWYADLALSKLDIREAVKTEEEHETKNQI